MKSLFRTLLAPKLVNYMCAHSGIKYVNLYIKFWKLKTKLKMPSNEEKGTIISQ